MVKTAKTLQSTQTIDALDSFFLQYQIEWINDDSLIKISEKGRREGFTFCQAYEDVRDCVTKKYFKKGRPLTVWFSSADITAAKEYIQYCKEFSEFFNEIAKDLGEIVIDKDKDIKALCIEFKNGARIHALSSNPSQFRSKGGKVVLDEFAHHEKQKELWKAAYASAKIWGYPIRIISTHNGKNSLFYKFIEKIKSGKLNFSLHSVPIQKAVEQGLADKILGRVLTQKERDEWLEEIRRDCGDEQAWLEEFCCMAVDEATAFLTYELIESCESDNCLLPLDDIAGDYYPGYDIARHKDLAVIAGGEKLGDVVWLRQLQIMEKTRFRDQKKELYKHLDHQTFRRSNIDSTGLGMQLAEDAQIDYGKTRVEDITFTNAVKEELAFLVLRTFQDRNIRIPIDNALKEDLHSIKKITTIAGHIRFDAERSETDGHGDRFWAIALMLHAAITKHNAKAEIRSRSARRKKQKIYEHDYNPVGGILRRGGFQIT